MLLVYLTTVVVVKVVEGKTFWVAQPLGAMVVKVVEARKVVEVRNAKKVVEVRKVVEVKLVVRKAKKVVEVKPVVKVVGAVKTFEVKFVWVAQPLGALLLVSKALLNLVQLKTTAPVGKVSVGKPFWGAQPLDGWVLVLVQWKSIGSAASTASWGATPTSCRR